MSIPVVLIPMFAYLLPAFILFYLAIDVFLRNRQKTEHRLSALIILSYVLLFIEEYIRHMVPIEYSSILVTYWFGNVGVLIPSLGLHFLVKVTKLNQKLPARLYPWIFYLPAILVFLTIFSGENIVNSQEFVQKGLWKVPVFNTSYYSSVFVGCLFIFMYVIILWKAKRYAISNAQISVLRLLIRAVVLVWGWTVVFGFINFDSSLPPHPYIYGGIIWGIFLRRSMIKYDFLSSPYQRFEKLFNINPLMILLLDEQGRIKEANPSAKSLLKVSNNTNFVFHEFIQKENLKEWKAVFYTSLRLERSMEKMELQLDLHTENKVVEVNGDYVVIDQIPHYMLIIRDITLDKLNDEKIRFLAYHDPLTQLSNRRYFKEKIEQVLGETAEKSQFGIVLIDLDHFKYVNDQYGHQIGDEFLQHTAKLLKEIVSSQGVAARLGGDEFIIYIPSIKSYEEANSYARLVWDGLESHPFQKGSLYVPVRASVGMSVSPYHGRDYDALLNHADKAMYEVKNSGRNSYYIQNY
ncbi:diguanylate cyclase domain-containing protein [Halobacillus sp. BBL2006]|uniref:diguanylate cyclase domain-containing protein n=1 Tax=Halobacillus sp. BBL2006 TaxID=1543706 RepID=UPI0006922DD3|nr:diguanylate cyclase [Halobacillus sp. BBL2006]